MTSSRGEGVLSRVIRNPVTQIALGVIVAWGFFYFVERKEIVPRYAVSEPELIAERTADAPGLQLFWEGEEIKNVYSTKIVIWNAGRQFLDKSSMSSTDPLRVVYPSDIKILYAKFVKTSRNNLTLDVTDRTHQGMNALEINIVGDEALERGDGGLLKILFIGPPTDDFVVTGRIKGSREGPTQVEWRNISTIRSWGERLLLLAFILLSAGGFIIKTIRDFRKAKGRGIRAWLAALGLFVMGGASIVALVYVLFIPIVTALYTSPPMDLFVG